MSTNNTENIPSSESKPPPSGEHNPKTCMSQQIMKTLDEMRTNNMLCDATITLDDKTVINIHRAILCSCSNYFRALFTSTLSDERTDVVIPGISCDSMKMIIDYAYLRRCELNEENVYEMLVVSDYVGMLGLHKLCIEFMERMLRSDNVICVWLFSK